MKLIIDIDEKIEEYIKDYIPIGAGDNVFCYPDEIVRMIQKGTPIPDNAVTWVDFKHLRDKILRLSCRYSISRERGCGGQVEWSDRLIKQDDVLKAFEEYKKGGKVE